MVHRSNGSATTEDVVVHLDALRKDLGGLVDIVNRLVSDQTHDTAETISGKIAAAKQKSEELVGQATDRVADAAKQTRESIEKNPVSAILIAIGLGFIIGLLSRR